MQYLQQPPFDCAFYDDRMRFELDNAIVFVFGSNLAGRHGMGAAKEAHLIHGAIYGKGNGFAGYSYAIPTKDENLKPLSLIVIKGFVDEFLFWNKANPDKPVYLTAIATGLSEYPHEAIAPLFNGVKNAWIPESWRKYIRI